MRSISNKGNSQVSQQGVLFDFVHTVKYLCHNFATIQMCNELIAMVAPSNFANIECIRNRLK